MKVSLIIRSRNDIAFAKQTLDALHTQSFTDFKIIAFDNSSTDGTRQIYDEYKNIEVVVIPKGA